MPFISSIRRNHDLPSTVNNEFEVTGGDVVYTAGGYKIHMFTSVGEAELSIKHVNASTNKDVLSLKSQSIGIEYLIVGGGGGGGTRHSGGGGAGGMVVGVGANLSANSYPVVVGAGAASRTGDLAGFDGQNSSLSTAVALGGGGGGNWGSGPVAGNSGASGGGSGGPGHRPNDGGVATQPDTTFLNGLGYGFNGGGCDHSPSSFIGAGGGGGAGGAGSIGQAAPGARAGTGGPGRQNSILGTNYYWAGGGGGGTWNGTLGGNGGRGGGGGGAGAGHGAGGGQALNSGQNGSGPTGTQSANTIGGNGGANTGSGGGACNQSPSTGGAGGPGIVVVRYRT